MIIQKGQNNKTRNSCGIFETDFILNSGRWKTYSQKQGDIHVAKVYLFSKFAMKLFEKILTFTLMIHIIIIPRPTSSNNCGYASVRVNSIFSSHQNLPTYYDKKQERCVIKIGSNCNQDSGRPKTNCPTNAYCSNHCVCNEGYAKGESEVICGKIVGSHGESCHNEVDGGDALVCDIHSGMTCQNGTCQCFSPEITVSENKCKPLVGEKCYTEGMDSKLECTNGAFCAENFWMEDHCECKDLYLAIDGGKCVGKPGTDCDTDKPCYNTLGCIDGQCVCPQPLNQIFDNQNNICVNLVGANCEVNKDNCTEFSECTALSRCTCKDEYVETPARTCKPSGIGYGDECESGTCDAGMGLACFQGKCQCVDSSLKYQGGVGCIASKEKRCGWIVPPSGRKCNNEGGNDCRLYFVGCENSASCVYQPKGFWVCK